MFTRAFSIFLVAAIATPALAASDRLSDVDYLRLSRCAAYTALPALADDGAASIAVRAKEQAAARSQVILSRAVEEAKEIRRLNRKSEASEALKAKRDTACAGL